MRYRVLTLMTMLALPAALPAQRAGIGRVQAAPDEDPAFAQPQMPEGKLEKGTPAAVLLDKKRKLSLNDSQLVAITALRKATADSNAAAYAAWDSVRTDMLIAGRSAAADPAEMMARRRRMMTVFQKLQARNQWARAEALKILTEEQRPKATEYWNDEDEARQRWLRPRGAGAGGARGHRPPSS